MSHIIELFIFSLFIFINNRFVRAFNESCGLDKPPCSDPLKCFGGYCQCSRMDGIIDPNSPPAFWTGDRCITCPSDYKTTAYKCFKLIVGKNNLMNWDRARQRCQEDGGDLLILRSQRELIWVSYVIQQNIQTADMLQRIPQNGSYFGSIWLGARLADWSGEGSYNLVAYGPPLTKNSFYWCSRSSPLGQEPNYVGLKDTGERQECVGLAIFPDKSICMHDWFCSWDSYVLCEIHPPPPQPNMTVNTNSYLEALEEKMDNKRSYMVIGGIGLFVLLASIGAIYYLCNKKKNAEHTQTVDSTESGLSEN